jgi:hypothetical protein
MLLAWSLTLGARQTDHCGRSEYRLSTVSFQTSNSRQFKTKSFKFSYSVATWWQMKKVGLPRSAGIGI